MASKQKLLALAKAVQRRFEPNGPIHPMKAGLTVEAYFDRPWVQLGELAPGMPTPFAMFDDNCGWTELEPLFWYGFEHENRQEVESLARIGARPFGRSGAMIDVNSDSFRRPKKKDGFGKPILEGTPARQRNPLFWYGVYLEKVPKLTDPEIEQAALFLSTIASKLKSADSKSDAVADAISDDLGLKSDAKERKVLRQHTAWERNPIISRMAKSRAKWQCKICLENLRAKYGMIEDYAEAHHKVPLHRLQGKKRTNTHFSELICVCANCHRMLHRLIASYGLDGHEAIRDLTARVKLAKKARTWAI